MQLAHEHHPRRYALTFPTRLPRDHFSQPEAA